MGERYRLYEIIVEEDGREVAYLRPASAIMESIRTGSAFLGDNMVDLEGSTRPMTPDEKMELQRQASGIDIED
jgi:hypothetical protein